MKGMKWQQSVFIVFILIVIGSLILYSAFNEDINIEQIRQNIKGFGIWTPVVFIAFYTVGTIFIPSTPFMALAGILFGFKYGFLYTVIGGFLSSIIIFKISRKLGKDQVEAILENKYLKYLNVYNERLRSGGIMDLIILRITPIMPFNALNIIMGVSKIKTADYIIGTLLGLVPSNIITVYFGSFLTKLF